MALERNQPGSGAKTLPANLLFKLLLLGALGALAVSTSQTASSTALAPEDTLKCGIEEATIVGTESADVLEGTSHRDVIVGRGGDDVIRALGDDDLVCGKA